MAERRRPPRTDAAASHLPRRLAGHALGFAALLMVLAPHMNLDTPWTADEGSYAIQVEALDDGTWDYNYELRSVDPDGTWFPIWGSSAGAGGRRFANVDHPAYILGLSATRDFVGEPGGLYLFSLAGALLLACATWVITAQVNERAAPWAFWIAAASPVLVNAFVMWAHALSAGLAAGATATAVSWVRHGWRPWKAVALMTTLASAMAVRSEAQLFAIALAFSIAVVIGGEGRRREAVTLVVAAVAFVTTFRIAEMAWIHRLVGGSFSETGVPTVGGPDLSTFVVRRLRAAWHVLFQGDARELLASFGALTVTAIALALLAGLALRSTRRGRVGVAVGACLATSALLILRFREDPLIAATGIAVTWPVALVGLAATRWRTIEAPLRLLALTSLLFTGAVLALQYDHAGGLEWGGRFLSPSLGAVATLAAIGLFRQIDALPPNSRRATGLVLAGVVAVPAIAGLSMLRSYREAKDPLYPELAAVVSPIVVLGDDDLRELPREAWRLDRDIQWLFAPDEGAEALRALHRAGVERVTFIGEDGDRAPDSSGYSTASDVTIPRFAAAGWRITVLSSG